jgi:hypothetical protein
MRLLLLFSMISQISFAQTHQSSWYKMLAGKIDKYPVTIHLHNSGHRYTGYYYYNNAQQPIYFMGDDTTIKGKIQLVGVSGPDAYEYFAFDLHADSIDGTWKKTDKSKPLHFSAKEIKTPINYLYVYSEGKTKLRPALPGSPDATFYAASIWPTGESPIEDRIKKEIRLSYAESGKDPGGDIGILFLSRKKKFFEGYHDQYKDVKNEELKESASYSMDESSEVLIAYQSLQLLSFAIHSYSYTGGAHGNHGTYYASFAVPFNKRLTVNDILTAEGTNLLQSLLEKNFRKKFGLKPGDSLTEAELFDNKIEFNSNFYVTGKGMGFSYDPYEIGPYSMGEIEIFIPFTELEAYLQPTFKSMVK